MKKPLPILASFLLLSISILSTLPAQTTNYTTTYKDGKYTCQSDKMIKDRIYGSNFYQTVFALISYDNYSEIHLGIQIGTFGDENLISIARLDKNSDHNDKYKTKATFTLESGDRIDISIVLVDDITIENAKKSTISGGTNIWYIFSSDDAVTIEKLRNQNIRTIEIEGHKIEMLQNMSLKSAPIIDDMFKEVIKKGYHLNTSSSNTTTKTNAPTNSTNSTTSANNPSASAKRPSVSTSYSPEPSSSKTKNAVELIYYPMGVLPMDVSGITYSSALSKVKSKTNWTIEEQSDFFSTDVSVGYDLKWHTISLFSSSMSFGKYIRWEYMIILDKTDYSRSQAEKYTKQFIKELADEGFSVDSDAMDGKTDYPIHKKLRKGTYRIEVLLTINENWYTININTYPNGY